MKSTIIKLQVFKDNDLHEWLTLDKPRMVMGSHSVADIRLEGLAPTQSMITRSRDRMQWHIHEMTSLPPLHVNGERVKGADLPNGSMIHFGATPWSIRVTVEIAEGVEEVWDTGHHHDQTFDTLCKEIEQADDQAANMILQVRSMWRIMDESTKRERLRGLVDIVREVRTKRHSRAEKAVLGGIADSLVGLVTENEWMKEVYKISPEQATAQAGFIFIEISQLQNAILNFQTFTKKYEIDHSTPGKKAGFAGCRKVEELYGKQMGDLVMKLTAYLNRAGGWTWEQEQARIADLRVEFQKNIDDLSEEVRNSPDVQKLIKALQSIGK